MNPVARRKVQVPAHRGEQVAAIFGNVFCRTIFGIVQTVKAQVAQETERHLRSIRIATQGLVVFCQNLVNFFGVLATRIASLLEQFNRLGNVPRLFGFKCLPINVLLRLRKERRR